ncbi:hypothetical protein TWF281_005761 [Arthrobotrys megalospora]
MTRNAVLFWRPTPAPPDPTPEPEFQDEEGGVRLDREGGGTPGVETIDGEGAARPDA